MFECCCVELAKSQRKIEIRRIVPFSKVFLSCILRHSLLFDTVLGFAYHICLHEDKENIAVTANLKINLRAPFREGSEAVVRVYLDRIERLRSSSRPFWRAMIDLLLRRSNEFVHQGQS